VPLSAGIHDAVVAHHLAVQVAQQYERQIERLGVGRVRAIAFDAQPQDLGAQVGELLVVLTELAQLAASYASEVEDVPQQHDGPTRQRVFQRNDLAVRGRQREAWRLVANSNRRCPLFVNQHVRWL